MRRAINLENLAKCECFYLWYLPESCCISLKMQDHGESIMEADVHLCCWRGDDKRYMGPNFSTQDFLEMCRKLSQILCLDKSLFRQEKDKVVVKFTPARE